VPPVPAAGNAVRIIRRRQRPLGKVTATGVTL